MTTPIDMTDYLVILIPCAVLMLICRVAPMLALKGRDLPEGIKRALGFIPPAVFAALVTNDLFNPSAFSGDAWGWIAPILAAAIVGVVGVKTKSMAWCIVVGVGALAVFELLPTIL